MFWISPNYDLLQNQQTYENEGWGHGGYENHTPVAKSEVTRLMLIGAHAVVCVIKRPI